MTELGQVHLVTGGAGFIGTNLASALVAKGFRVLLVDDLSRGIVSNINHLLDSPSVAFRQVDCADAKALSAAAASVEAPISHVWHLAANSDIPAGVSDPRIDFYRTFQTTFGVLEFMRQAATPCLHFASSSAIYGDFGAVEIHEDIGPLVPISNYGAMKLASEAQISAAIEAFLPRAEIYRFPNVIGVPATHGVIWDFVRKLVRSPDELQVLGDGSQQKAYMHVSDLVGAMFHISGQEGRRLVFNIGPEDDGVSVRFIAETVRDLAAPKAHIVYGSSNRGWIGDVPRFRYSIRRLTASGWSPRWSSQDTVVHAAREIVRQELGRP